MERVLSNPKAAKWLAGKTTGKYLRMMARLSTAEHLRKAAEALHHQGVRDHDQDAVDLAAQFTNGK